MVRKKQLFTLVSVMVLLLLWDLTALRIGASVILPRPLDVLGRLAALVQETSFRSHVAASTFRVGLSFFLSLVLGLVLGVSAGLSEGFRYVIAPLIISMRTIPVMAIILIAILWFPSGMVSVFAALLMALPVTTEGVSRAILGIDKKLVEMATIFKLSRYDRLSKVIVPQIIPSLLTSAYMTLGLCWKVVIAGEIITIPKGGIGGRMQLAQLSLESEKLFAWTLVVVAFASLSQVVLKITEKLAKRFMP